MSRTLVTGHTGFKGSWLVHRLVAEGHSVAGFSLPPSPDSHYVKSQTRHLLDQETFGDITDLTLFDNTVESFRPDQIIHLAAQAIVSVSFSDPRETISTNVEGTNSVISSAVRHRVQRALIITSDKVYKDKGEKSAKVESSELGGFDPYSASKAAADIISQAWAGAQSHTVISIARGGNVLGGGDRGLDRLLPDFERALSSGECLHIRNPSHVRPWQHVLDCLDGYLRILNAPNVSSGEVWNVGPAAQSSKDITVEELLDIYKNVRGSSPAIRRSQSQMKETEFLHIDTTKMTRELSWEPLFDSMEVISQTASWERMVAEGNASPADATTGQVHDYLQRRRSFDRN